MKKCHVHIEKLSERIIAKYLVKVDLYEFSSHETLKFYESTREEHGDFDNNNYKTDVNLLLLFFINYSYIFIISIIIENIIST